MINEAVIAHELRLIKREMDKDSMSHLRAADWIAHNKAIRDE